MENLKVLKQFKRNGLNFQLLNNSVLVYYNENLHKYIEVQGWIKERVLFDENCY